MSARCFLVAASLSLAALLGPCAVTAVATTSEGATDSEIFWVSEPVAPGETAVAGEGEDETVLSEPKSDEVVGEASPDVDEGEPANEHTWVGDSATKESLGNTVGSVNCWVTSGALNCRFRGYQQRQRRRCVAKVNFPRGWFRTKAFYSSSGAWTYTATARRPIWVQSGSLKPSFVNLRCW